MKNIKIITGAAGTGKTEQIKQEIIDLNGQPYFVVAPTNKAAKVLQQRGIKAKTIHSALYVSSKTGETKEVQRPVISCDTGLPITNDLGETLFSIEIEDMYEYSFKDDLHESFTIIIDEASMVPSKIWRDILTHFKGTLIVVGDPQQLLPVESDDEDFFPEYEQYFNKLAPHADLYLGDNTANKRLADDAAGIMMAINHIAAKENFKGEFPSLWGNQDIGYTHVSIKQNHTLDQDVQDLLPTVDTVICWRNIECDFINNFIRQKKHGKRISPFPIPGDRLYADGRYSIVVKDHFTDEEEHRTIVTKGDELIIDVCSSFDQKNNIMWVLCKGIDQPIPLSLAKIIGGRVPKGIDHLRWSYAYAITCHKAQGSGWENVVVLDSHTLARDSKRWRYTAATRAKKNLVVIVANESFDKVRL